MKKLSLAVCLSLVAVTVAPLLSLPAHAQNIAIVNGKAVPKSRVDALTTQITKQAAARGQQLPADLDRLVRDKVVLDEMFVQEAEKRGLAASADYKTQMELARENILVQALLADYEKKNPVSEADIKAEYDKFKAQSAGTEYRARHILVEKEDEAKDVIAQLQKGGKFDELAKARSKDPGSKDRGGDLDWNAAGGFVKPFSDAMIATPKGKFTAQPVQTQFGYHVIQVDDLRDAKIPPFDEVRPQLQQRMQAAHLDRYFKELRAKGGV